MPKRLSRPIPSGLLPIRPVIIRSHGSNAHYSEVYVETKKDHNNQSGPVREYVRGGKPLSEAGKRLMGEKNGQKR